MHVLRYVHRVEESSATQGEKNGGGSPGRKLRSTASASAFGNGDVDGLVRQPYDHFGTFINILFWVHSLFGLCITPQRRAML